jgi:hypothetical protein
MKRILVGFLILGAIFLMTITSNTAQANIITTYSDTIANWPGQITGDSSSPLYRPKDEYGVPRIDSITITTNDDGYLLGVSINMEHWLLSDSLFINTGDGSWDSWDYLVYGKNANTGFLYTVAEDFDYTYAGPERRGHANGIESDDLTSTAGLISYKWTGAGSGGVGYYDLDYTFDGRSIKLGESWVIGYTPLCANDVVLTPIPEPTQMLLLGTALIGLAGIGRKKFFKK